MPVQSWVSQMDNLETIKSVLRKNGTSCEIPASVPTNEHAQSRLCICRGKKMLTQGRCRLLESGTAIEHRWCSPSADGMKGGWGEDLS